MKLLMISGDRSVAVGKQGAFSQTLSELSKYFERIDVVCPASSDRGEKKISENVFVHSSSHSLWYQPFFILQKGRELFHVHHHTVMTVHEYPPFYNGIGARLLKRRISIPAALEIHHIVGWPKASSLREWIGCILSRLLLRFHTKHFEAVRVVNGTVKAQMIAWGVPAEKISVVPSVYLDHRLIESAKNQQKKFDLVFAARLADNKGLLQTIEAVALLPHATLLVIGDGPLRKQAEKLVCSLGISSRVIFAGWLPTARDVLASIASGRLFIMNSKSEGNPRVAIEAMALGVPVLATRVGIMPDVIEDSANGVFTNGTAAGIAQKAQALLADDVKRASMGTEAAKIAGRFEKKAAIKVYADFLQSLAH